MAIDQHYIPAFSIEDVLLDKDTGAPLSGGIVTFYRDSQRGTLKDVYQITGTSPNYTFIALPNPMILSAIGTFEDSMSNPVIPYFLPYIGDAVDYYYVTVESSGNVPQFVRESVPFVPQTGGDTAVSGAYQNELSNPQFAEILFHEDSVTGEHIYNFTAGTTTVEIAPGWSLVVNAAGVATVTVEQLTPTGALNIITNPGTLLNIKSAGTSSIRLRQRLYGSPNLWGSGYISASFVAKNYSGGAADLILYYSQSNGAVTDQQLVLATLPGSGSYAAYADSALIPVSTSAQFFPDAYIDIDFLIPNGIEIDITSVMLSSTGTVSIPEIIYDQESNDRQIDHLFHYYKDSLIQKPMPSYTLGWDFPYNPCQKLGNPIPINGVAIANKSFYVADQTIVFQTVPNVMDFTITQPGGLTANTASTTSFAVIQYLDGKTARELLTGRMAVQVKGYVFNGSQTSINGNVSLWWTTDAQLPDMKSANYNSLVSSVSSAGVVTCGNGTWTQVPRSNMGSADFTLPLGAGSIFNEQGQAFSLNGWDATATSTPSSTATYFAIVIGFANLTAGTSVVLRYCTLNSGDLASPPSPLNQAETLYGLQYYFETSYFSGNIPGSEATPPGTAPDAFDRQAYLIAQATGAAINAYPTPIDVVYNTVKRAVPNFTFYNPVTGSGDSINSTAYVAGAPVGVALDTTVSTNFTSTVTTRNTHIVPKTANVIATGASASTTAPFGKANYHFEADARFGIVL